MRHCPSCLHKRAGCKCSLLEVSEAQRRFPAVTHGTITLTSGNCMGEKWVVLARDLLEGTWWESLCLTEVVPGLSPVRGGAGSNNIHSSSKGWFQYLLGFPSGKKGWCRVSGPQQWVPALSASLERAVAGESSYDWATGFYGGLEALQFWAICPFLHRSFKLTFAIAEGTLSSEAC